DPVLSEPPRADPGSHRRLAPRRRQPGLSAAGDSVGSGRDLARQGARLSEHGGRIAPAIFQYRPLRRAATIVDVRRSRVALLMLVCGCGPSGGAGAGESSTDESSTDETGVEEPTSDCEPGSIR